MIIIDEFLPFEMIIPMNYTFYRNEELIIHAYDEVKYIAEQFLSLYGTNPFTDSALIWLNNAMYDKMTESGYDPDVELLFDWCCLYKLTEKNQICSELIQPTTIKLLKNQNYDNLTDFDINFALEQHLICYVTIIENKIVSIASENYGDDDKSIEVAVETASDYQHKGYAVSNVIALTENILNRNKFATYNCKRYNVASQKTAIKSGFIFDGNACFYICYKKE